MLSNNINICSLTRILGAAKRVIKSQVLDRPRSSIPFGLRSRQTLNPAVKRYI